MPISVTCDCGQSFKLKDELAGKKGKCPSCGGVLVIPGPAPKPVEIKPPPPSPRPATPPQDEPMELEAAEAPAKPKAIANERAVLHVIYPGRSFLFDVTVEVFLDGKPAGTGFIKRGVDLKLKTTVGVHTLELRFMGKARAYTVDLAESGTYEARVSYSRTGNFAKTLELIAPGGEPVTQGKARKAAGGKSSGGPFFSCRVPNSGPLGLAENVTMSFIAAPTLRPATVKIQEGKLTVSSEDANGFPHDLLTLPTSDIASVEAGPFTKAGQFGMLMSRWLLSWFGLTITMAIAIAFGIGFNKLSDEPVMYLYVLLASVVGALVITFFAVLLPGLIKGRRLLSRLEFHKTDGDGFAVMVDADELEEARRTLGGAKLEVLRSKRAR